MSTAFSPSPAASIASSETGPWFEHLPRSLDYPDVGIDALLAGAARAHGNRVALRQGEVVVTYQELLDRSLRIAGGFRARGIEPGDVVALHMPNSISFVLAYYGALCAGAGVAPVNPAQPVEALRHQLEDVHAKAVVSSPGCLAVALEADAACVDLVVCVPGPEGDHNLPAGVLPIADLEGAEPLLGEPVDPSLVAHLQLTGGTTGRSKAVRVLHRNLVASVIQNACWRAAAVPETDEAGGVTVRQVSEAAGAGSLTPGAGVYLAVPPFFHGLGLVGHNIEVILGNTVVIPTEAFHPDGFLALVESQRVTHVIGSPAMYYALLRAESVGVRDLTSIVLLISGAAPIDTTALRTLGEVFPRASVLEGYGLSEATMGVAGLGVGVEPAAPLGSIGVPLFDTRVEIRDAEGGPVPVGEIGELWVRGPQVADGYQDEPELTAHQFRDGWLLTGDSGRVDENGYLHLVGRSKDLVIYKGYNVYPQPLEEILCSHPAVAQAAIVGKPSETAGEVPVAFVVLRPDVEVGDGLADEVMAYVAERVAPYQRVRELFVLDTLPVTATGKVRKVELRDRVSS